MVTDAVAKSSETNQDVDEEEEEDFTKADDYDGHQPKPDYIVAVEVYNHKIHSQYRDYSLLTNILKYDHVVFYEIPYSLKTEDNKNIVIPCVFRDEYYRYNFGMPIYLSVPRYNCKGKDIQEALQVTRNISNTFSSVYYMILFCFRK
jgi:hypothetical protein